MTGKNLEEIENKKEPIRRLKNKTENFTIVFNEVFQRADLSARAKGIYAYIMTLPDDWLLCKQELYTHFAEGRSALDAGFRELEDAGYIKKRLLRDERGRIVATEYTVYESAEMNDEPKAAEPIAVNQQLLSTKSTKDLEGPSTKKEKGKEETCFFSTMDFQKKDSGGEPIRESTGAGCSAPPGRRGTTYSPGSVDFAEWFEQIRVHWNTLFPDEPCNRSAATLSYVQRDDLLGAYKTYNVEHCKEAIGRYNRIRGSPERFDPKGCVYPSGLLGFLKSGVDIYGADAVFVRFKAREQRESEEARMQRLMKEAW
jgi:hypothetical protein